MEEYGKLAADEFAARLRAARAYLGWRLEDAEPHLGISRQALSRRESGAVAIRLSDRYVMATIYCRETGWPVEFFTEEKIPPIPLTSPDEGGELGAGDVARFVSEPLGDAALP